MKLIRILALALFLAPCATVMAGPTTSTEGARVYFVSPDHGARLTSPVTVIFGLKGMGVAPAGTQRDGTGHHHLLIDAEKLPALDQPLDKSVKHFGGGQTETVLDLSPGTHVLQLILADHQHIPHDPPVISDQLTIEVVEN